MTMGKTGLLGHSLANYGASGQRQIKILGHIHTSLQRPIMQLLYVYVCILHAYFIDSNVTIAYLQTLIVFFYRLQSPKLRCGLSTQFYEYMATFASSGRPPIHDQPRVSCLLVFVELLEYLNVYYCK